MIFKKFAYRQNDVNFGEVLCSESLYGVQRSHLFVRVLQFVQRHSVDPFLRSLVYLGSEKVLDVSVTVKFEPK